MFTWKGYVQVIPAYENVKFCHEKCVYYRIALNFQGSKFSQVFEEIICEFAV